MPRLDCDSTAQRAADSLVQLCALVNRSHVQRNTAAQWAALRFFARANRFSRTVSAFSDYHGTTRGTASQTVKTLVERGLLARERSPRDGRSQFLMLTNEGRRLLAADPLGELSQAVADLPAEIQIALDQTLQQLLGSVADAVGKPNFGRCADCFFCSDRGCLSYRQTLDDGELEQYCIHYQPAKVLGQRLTQR